VDVLKLYMVILKGISLVTTAVCIVKVPVLLVIQ